jgi:hypothetical protein
MQILVGSFSDLLFYLAVSENQAVLLYKHTSDEKMGKIFGDETADCVELHEKPLCRTIAEKLQNLLRPLMRLKLRVVGQDWFD